MGDAPPPSPSTAVNNYINSQFVPPNSNRYISITNPSTSTDIGQVALSNSTDVNSAVNAAHSAFQSWSRMTVKARAAIMLRYHALVRENAEELANLIVLENGKNLTEALADVAKVRIEDIIIAIIAFILPWM